MAFDATVGGAAATSLISVDNFRDYCETRPGPSDALTTLLTGLDSAIEPYLVAATDDITYVVNWDRNRVGDVVTPTQALRFPAEYVETMNDSSEYYSTSAIPDFVIKAVSEQAIIGYVDGGALTQSSNRDLAEVKVDVIELRFNRQETGPEMAPSIMERVKRILSYWAVSFSDEAGNFGSVQKRLSWDDSSWG